MRRDVSLGLPAVPNQEAILERLDRVLDPELDESILELGFVESLESENAHLTVTVRLPTYFCAPNFVYLMAEDIRRELLTVEGVQEVTVRLTGGHFASEEIEAGVNTGKVFAEAFPDEAFENLGELRNLFLRKGYLKRQEHLLRRLIDGGLSFEEISALRIDAVSFKDDSSWVRRADGKFSRVGTARIVVRYLRRLAELGFNCSQTAPLLINLRGDPILPEQLEQYFIKVRTVRVAMEANASLCSGLLEARKAKKGKVSLTTKEQ